MRVLCSARGLGDCGVEQTYKWLNDKDKKEFELILQRQQDECILDRPENQGKTQVELQEIMKNFQFPVVYQK